MARGRGLRDSWVKPRHQTKSLKSYNYPSTQDFENRAHIARFFRAEKTFMLSCVTDMKVLEG